MLPPEREIEAEDVLWRLWHAVCLARQKVGERVRERVVVGEAHALDRTGQRGLSLGGVEEEG